VTRTGRVRGHLTPRCVGPIGGTTTLADCIVALRYLLSRRKLVDGPVIAEYEAEFARVAGARFACSFWAGRVGLYALLLGLGIGRYTTTYRTTSEASTCQQHCADTGPRVTSRSRDTGYHAAVGADYHLRAKDVISVEFRHLKLDANFDDIGLGDVKAGGSLLWLGYRRYF